MNECFRAKIPDFIAGPPIWNEEAMGFVLVMRLSTYLGQVIRITSFKTSKRLDST